MIWILLKISINQPIMNTDYKLHCYIVYSKYTILKMC